MIGPVTCQDVARFLAERAGEKAGVFRCPLCRGLSFLTAGNGMALIDLPVGLLPGLRPSGNLPVIWLSCENCGHIILISRRRVEAWLRERDPVSPIETPADDEPGQP